jgi:hypothetical protein
MGNVGEHQVGGDQLEEHVLADVPRSLLISGAKRHAARLAQRGGEQFFIDRVEVDFEWLRHRLSMSGNFDHWPLRHVLLSERHHHEGATKSIRERHKPMMSLP